MKKAILTAGLFSFVMVLTSFTKNEEIKSTTKNDKKAEIFKVLLRKIDAMSTVNE